MIELLNIWHGKVRLGGVRLGGVWSGAVWCGKVKKYGG